MHIDFHLEEPSAEAAIKNLVKNIIRQKVTLRFLVYNGKSDLLKKLPNRLRSYKGGWVTGDYRIVVLIDSDRQDCRVLKRNLEDIALSAQLITKSSTNSDEVFQVLNRIAIEELEAWFFGDFDALVRAYPNVPINLQKKAKYRNPDTIGGGTWETLERVLQNAGYYSAGMPKIEVARRISKHMDPLINTSRSFQVFRDGLLALQNHPSCLTSNQ